MQQQHMVIEELKDVLIGFDDECVDSDGQRVGRDRILEATWDESPNLVLPATTGTEQTLYIQYNVTERSRTVRE